MCMCIKNTYLIIASHHKWLPLKYVLNNIEHVGTYTK